MKKWLGLALLLWLTSLQASALELDQHRQFDIAAQPLATALIRFAQQTDIQVVTAGQGLEGVDTQGVTGDFSMREALQRLLLGTGFSFRVVGDGTISIVASSRTTPDRSQKSDPPATGSASPPQGPQQTPVVVEEVLVTAQKREERLQDVPVPLTALSAQQLTERNQLRLQDYYASVPGLSLATDPFTGAPLLAVRGIVAAYGQAPTVGVLVDDVPFGSSTSQGDGYEAPELDPSDLQRVEVLRGPQGTLYGADSMGGLIKYVTIDPSVEAFTGRVEGGLSGVSNGTQLGYNTRASANVPINENLALRLSGFSRQDPGYVDNLQTGDKAVNWARLYGGRVSGLWKASDLFTVKISALIQDSHKYGSPLVDVGTAFGDLQQSVLKDTGGYQKKIQAYSATLTAKVAQFDLTSVSGYNVAKTAYATDFSIIPFYAGLAQTQFGVSGVAPHFDLNAKKFTQELRLSGPVASWADWLFGGFYTHESSHNDANWAAENPVNGATVAAVLVANTPSTYSEYAAFTDLTFHLVDRLAVQVGARESHISQTQTQRVGGPFVTPALGLPNPFSYPKFDSDATAFTYLVTPTYKLAEDSLLYARFASGYRAGGPNVTPQIFNGVPASFKPDKTRNYEVGIKSDVADKLMSVDASVYYIDWSDVQISEYNPSLFVGYTANAGKAKSEGLELALDVRPTSSLTVSAHYAYNKAVLTEPLPPGAVNAGSVGVAGDRLPYSARNSGSLAFDQTFPIIAGMNGFAGLSVSYIGDRQGVFVFTPARQVLPAYTQTDLRAGVRTRDWRINLFANNVTNRRGVLNGGIGTLNAAQFGYIQPRTVGVLVSRSF